MGQIPWRGNSMELGGEGQIVADGRHGRLLVVKRQVKQLQTDAAAEGRLSRLLENPAADGAMNAPRVQLDVARDTVAFVRDGNTLCDGQRATWNGKGLTERANRRLPKAAAQPIGVCRDGSAATSSIPVNSGSSFHA